MAQIMMTNVEGEPDIECECPNCGGTLAVWFGEAGDEDLCVLEGLVHIRPDEEVNYE